MSYILDALRKADAQRERDAGRGIHAQPVPAAVPTRRPGTAPRFTTFLALAAGIFVAAAGGWYVARSPAQPPREEPVEAAPRQPAPPSQPVAANAIVPAPAPAPAQIPQRPVQAQAAAPQTTQPMQPAAQAPQPAQGTQAPVAAAGLPADAPKVAISGGVYSPNPAQRMLIVNGQVYNEGSEVAPGLAIEKIEARTATLKYRGARYTVAY